MTHLSEIALCLNVRTVYLCWHVIIYAGKRSAFRSAPLDLHWKSLFFFLKLFLRFLVPFHCFCNKIKSLAVHFLLTGSSHDIFVNILGEYLTSLPVLVRLWNIIFLWAKLTIFIIFFATHYLYISILILEQKSVCVISESPKIIEISVAWNFLVKSTILNCKRLFISSYNAVKDPINCSILFKSYEKC